MKSTILILAAGLLLAACSSDKAVVDGRFSGCGKGMVYLEKVIPGVQAVADSVQTDDKGHFKFKVKLDNGQGTIFNLRHSHGNIPLILMPGDRAEVSMICQIPENYTVTGSKESESLRELRMMLTDGAASLDSLLTLYASAGDQRRTELGREYMNEYYRIKRDHIKFIVSDPGTLAALYGLYQRLPGDTYLFDENNDVIYYRQVADAVEEKHPESPYLKSLRREISSAETSMNMISLLNDRMQNSVDFPDLTMSDIYGNEHRLHDFTGSVILLDFWSVTSAQGRLNNAEYKQLFVQYFPEGFEIYQVAVDRDRSAWVNGVLDQKLPWITVSDLRGETSQAVMAYNVRNVPSNYLIDRQGNIVAKNIYGDQLEAKLKELLK